MPHQCTSCGHVFEDGSKEMLSGCPDCGGNKFQFRPGGVSTGSVDAGESEDGSIGAGTESIEGSPSGAEPPERPGDDASSVAKTVGRATTKVRDFVASDARPRSAESNSDAEWPGDWNGDATDSGTSPGRSEKPLVSGGNTSESPDGNEATDRNAADRNAADRNTSADTDDDIIDADARRRAREADGDEDVAQVSARTDVVSPDEIDDRTDDSDGSTDDATDGSTPDDASDGTIVSEPTGEEADLADLREQLNEQFESIKVLEPGQYELNLMELYDREEYIIALQENGRYVIQVPEQWMCEDPDDR